MSDPSPPLTCAPTFALTLASASPRRARLLRSAGIVTTVAPVACDETPREGEPPIAYARRIADQKLAAALMHHEQTRPVLVADTIVWHDGGPPIGKPTSAEHAEQILVALTTGGAHNVSTAWKLARRDGSTHQEVETTRVFMRPLLSGELNRYLATDAWRDKAGGYGIQGLAAAFVTRVEGSYTNVVGLPLAQVVAALGTWGHNG